MPTGVYPRTRDESKWTSVICAQCGSPRRFLFSFLKIHPIQFCSKKCEGLAKRRPETKVEVSCCFCGKKYIKRRRFLKERNYCSPGCGRMGKRKKSIWSEHYPDKEARRVYFRKYTSENRARLNALSAEWARTHRSYRQYINILRRAAGALTKAQFEQLWVESGGRCAHCGATENLQVDHKLAVARGGKTELGNLQILCKPCNVSKGIGDAPLLPRPADARIGNI